MRNAVSEAGERAVRDGLFGATGPESVLSVQPGFSVTLQIDEDEG